MKFFIYTLCAAMVAVVVSGCVAKKEKRTRTSSGEVGTKESSKFPKFSLHKTTPAAHGEKPFLKQTGIASHFWPQRTASGHYYHSGQMIAAHKTLPMGTRVKVKDHKTGKSCWVTITDRGPYVHGRIIDLSDASAKTLGIYGSRGIGKVDIEAYRGAPLGYQRGSGTSSKKPAVKSSKKTTTKKPSTKPSTKPTTKPTAKPTAKPSTKPSTKPATKPTAKPTAKPSTKPTKKS